MFHKNKSTDVEKIYLPKDGVVMIEYQKKARPNIKVFVGG